MTQGAPQPTGKGTPIAIQGAGFFHLSDGPQILYGTAVETVMTTFDSLGQPHNITMRFVKVPNANAWDWEASTVDPAIITPNPLASGTITFDTSGLPQTDPTQPEGILDLQFSNGAADATGATA